MTQRNNGGLRSAFVIHAEPYESALVPALREAGIGISVLTHRGKGSDMAYRGVAPVVLNSPEASFGMVPKTWTRPLEPARNEDLEALAPMESRVFEMLERSNFPVEAAQELRSRYLHLVSLWGSLFDAFRPDIVIIRGGIPNKGYDFVVYLLAQRRGIPVSMLTGTLVEDRLLPLRDIYNVPGPSREDILEEVQNLPTNVNVTEKVESTGDADGSIAHALHSKANNLSSLRGRMRWPRIATPLLQKEPMRRMRPVPCFHGNPQPRNIEWRLRTFAGLLKGRRLLAYYDSISKPANLAQKYVYVPLSVQPETQTCVSGRLFSDHWLVAQTVSRAIPKGWRVLVKEHPNQFNRGFLMSKGRSYDFYERFRALDNVDLVDLETSADALTEHSQAVAVVAGTSGWDGIHRGVPALTFGSPWYGRAPGVYACRGVHDVKAALKKAQSETISPEMLTAYRNLMHRKYTVRGLALDAFVGRIPVTPEEHISTVVNQAVAILNEAAFEVELSEVPAPTSPYRVKQRA